jgi:TolB-like protein
LFPRELDWILGAPKPSRFGWFRRDVQPTRAPVGLFDKSSPANSRKSGCLAREQLPREECRFFPSDAMCGSLMSSELNADLELEIGHVLFIDIVGYSKLLINEQHESLHELNQVVRNTDAFRAAEAAGKLIRLPTGDGMALAFATTPDAPVRCAMQTSKALRSRPGLKVRMGVHSGPVSGMTDVNDRSNVAGAGMNMAQRVMDCGDAGHILLSKRVAEDLAQYRHWQPNLHDLGECEVKHGVIVSVVNLYTSEVGNPALPEKFNGKTPRRRAADAGVRLSPVPALNTLLTIVFFSAVAAAIGYWIFFPPAALEAPESHIAPRTEPAAAPAKSIAVLPFENLSANQETAFFADGVQDEILTALAKVSDLKVISRTSVIQYKAVRKRNLREIGQQLGVANILEGSVQRIDNRIRINAQLIDTRTDTHLWAQTYDRDLADVFAIQSEISKAIAEQLQAKISASEKAALAQAPTTDLVADKLFFQARELIFSGSDPDAKQSLLQAVRLLDEALARDPKFLRAYALLTILHLDLYWQGFDHTDARREHARQTVEAAARVAADAGEVHLMPTRVFGITIAPERSWTLPVGHSRMMARSMSSPALSIAARAAGLKQSEISTVASISIPATSASWWRERLPTRPWAVSPKRAGSTSARLRSSLTITLSEPSSLNFRSWKAPILGLCKPSSRPS